MTGEMILSSSFELCRSATESLKAEKTALKKDAVELAAWVVRNTSSRSKPSLNLIPAS